MGKNSHGSEMPLATSSFGVLPDDAGLRLQFPAGLPAFEQETRFMLLAPPETAPLVFLQSERSAGLCFIAVPVDAVCADYDLALSAEDLALCGFEPDRLPRTDEITVLAILATGGTETTANLLAPVVVNRANGRAVQAVRADRVYSHRHAVRLPELEAGACS
jgi:flagellar assembly factor FliW